MIGRSDDRAFSGQEIQERGVYRFYMNMKSNKGKIEVSLTPEEWLSLKVSIDKSKQHPPDWKQKDIEDAMTAQSAVMNILYGGRTIREPIKLDLPVFFGQKGSDIHKLIHNGLDNASRMSFDTEENYKILKESIENFVNLGVNYTFTLERKMNQASWVGGDADNEITRYSFSIRICKFFAPSRVRQEYTTNRLVISPIDIHFAIDINDNENTPISDIDRLAIQSNYYFVLSGDIHFNESNQLDSVDIEKLYLINSTNKNNPVLVINKHQEDFELIELERLVAKLKMETPGISESSLPLTAFDDEPPF